MTNPLLAAWETPFEAPPFDRIEPQHFRLAFDEAMAGQRREVEAVAGKGPGESFADTIEALELILETKPDLVITAQVMPRMSGVDLACALAAMPATRGIPVALLTSLDPDHPDLRALPMNVGLIRRGKQFGDDLADVLQRFHIT